jgi:hypothetical protein
MGIFFSRGVPSFGPIAKISAVMKKKMKINVEPDP